MADITVSEGDRAEVGDEIGKQSDVYPPEKGDIASHLHFEVRNIEHWGGTSISEKNKCKV